MAGARNAVQLPVDGAGKKTDALSYDLADGRGTVYAPTAVICDRNGNIVDTVSSLEETTGSANIDSAAGSDEFGYQATGLAVMPAGVWYSWSPHFQLASTIAGSGTFTGSGAIDDINNVASMLVSVVTDQTLTLKIDQFNDAAATKLCSTWTLPVTANVPFARILQTAGNYLKLTLTNTTGSTANVNMSVSYGPPQNSQTQAGNLPVAIAEAPSIEVPFTTTTVQAVATTDCANYRWISVQITSQGTSSLVAFQASNDNVNWVNVSLQKNDGTTNASDTATGLYNGPVTGRYFRLNVTGISAGTTAGRVEFWPLPAVMKTMDVNLNDSTAVGIGSLPGGPINALAVGQSATNFVSSTGNSSVAQLIANATFAGAVESVWNQQAVSVLLTTDQAGVLTLVQYIDAGGTRPIATWTFAIAANVPFSRSFISNGNYFKASYTNGSGGTTTTLNLNVAYGTLDAMTNLGNKPVMIGEVGGVDHSQSPVQFFTFNTAAQQTNATILAAQTGKSIRVIAYALMAAAAVNFSFVTPSGTGVVLLPLAANTGVSFAGSILGPAFQTGSAVGLFYTTSGAVQVSGHVAYVLV